MLKIVFKDLIFVYVLTCMCNNFERDQYWSLDIGLSTTITASELFSKQVTDTVSATMR